MTPRPARLTNSDVLAAARDLLESSGSRHVPVVDGQGAVVGMVSDTDLVDALASGCDQTAPVGTCMRRAIPTVWPDTPAHEAARMLVESGVSALPVIDATERLVGVVSATDLLSAARQGLREPRSQRTPVVVDTW